MLLRFSSRAIARVALAFGPPPTEFRIFKSGWNDTYKGDFLFDDEAAALVMAAYKEHGVDRPIDLEHFSIPDENGKVQDPDARGWFKLEVRNGELWATDVKWTPDGTRRMTEATQRYISPWFGFDPKTRRVQSLYNVAICAIPATKDMPALVAASARSKLELAALSIEANHMDYKKLIAALGLKEDASLEDALGAIKAFQEEDGKGKEQAAKLRKMLKLGDDAPFEDVEAAMKKLTGGEPDGDEPEPKKEEASDDPKEDEEEKKEMAKLSPKVRGMVLGMQANIEKLTQQVASLTSNGVKNEVEELIAKNTDKIPLSMEAHLREQGAKFGVEVVKSYLKHAVPGQRPKTPPQEKGKGDDIESLKLTPEEKNIAKLSNIPLDDALKFKKERAKKERDAAAQAD